MLLNQRSLKSDLFFPFIIYYTFYLFDYLHSKQKRRDNSIKIFLTSAADVLEIPTTMKCSSLVQAKLRLRFDVSNAPPSAVNRNLQKLVIVVIL